MDKSNAIALLQGQLKELEEVLPAGPDTPAFEVWQRNTVVVLRKVFGEEADNELHFINIDYTGHQNWGDGGTSDAEAYSAGMSSAKALLQASIVEVERFWPADEGLTTKTDVWADCSRIFERFHKVAKQIQIRHADRETLRIVDEYDVQDLLHGLLRLYYEDIRPEEWTPSYAGGSSRMDFLLKAERVVIETKLANSRLTARAIGEQLLIDIEKYRNHPDCGTLYCFVYDPEGSISNPRGIENDLRRDKPMRVEVLVRPR